MSNKPQFLSLKSEAPEEMGSKHNFSALCSTLCAQCNDMSEHWGLQGPAGSGLYLLLSKETPHRCEDLNTLREIKMIQYESIMILIIIHSLSPKNSSWGVGQRKILIPGKRVKLWDKFSKQLI